MLIEPRPERRQRRMHQVIFQMPPHARQEMQVMPFAIAHGEAGENVSFITNVL